MDIKNPPTALSIYFCGSEPCAPGHFFGPAVRPHYLIHVILKGKGIYKRKGKTYHLQKGDAFLISPVESTYYEADSQDPWEYAWVGFDGQYINSLLEMTCFQDSCIYCSRTETEKEQVLQKMLEILDCFRSPSHSPLMLTGLFLQLLGIIQGPTIQHKENYPKQYLTRAKEYMNNNYSYNIRIADIAASIGIDRTYLYRIFIEEEQISPKQYLLQLRLRIAAGMLRSMEYTVTEVAYSCGFKDAAAFCNHFKKSMGFTPSQFREYLKSETKYGV